LEVEVMPVYRVSGTIMLESTRDEARYDYEVYFDGKPNEMDILDDMIQSGEIQILHETTEEVDE
jgi:hypothetical protein